MSEFSLKVIGFNLSNLAVFMLDDGLDDFPDIDLFFPEDGVDIELLLDLSWIEFFFAQIHGKVLEQMVCRTSLNLLP